jgi:hypothetical protein
MDVLFKKEFTFCLKKSEALAELPLVRTTSPCATTGY